MATNDTNQVNIEAILIKCFLYKYTPPFVAGGVTANPGLSKFAPYSTTLDDTQYYTKYDISDFVASYTFEQDITETTYNWNVELQDLPLSYSTIDSKLKVKQPDGSVGAKTSGLAFSTSTNSIAALAQYETDANNNTSANQEIIETAKTLRGTAPGGLTVQNVDLTSVLSTIPGLRLSDLIQEYDFISVFLYKNTTPLEEVTGTISLVNGYPVFSPSALGAGNSPSSTDLQNETVLMSKMFNGSTLFSNEINGFIMKKVSSNANGQVDRVTISGNGWTRLFGATRRVVKPSLFQGSLYEQGQLLTLNDVSATTTVFAGRTTADIIRDLLDLTYRIDFQSTNSVISGTGTTIALNGAYFNISSLIVGNSPEVGPSNLFTVPQYLLSVIMKRRNFAYIEPIDADAFTDDVASQLDDETPPEQFQSIIASTGGQTIHYTGTQPVVVTNDVQNLTTYFEFLDEVYRNFSPDLKTPYEILDDIRTLTFVELFELPSGQFLIRSPQYNNTNIYDPTQPQTDLNRSDISMVLSSDLQIITASYPEQVENLVSKIFTGYAANFVPEGALTGMEQFAYCDGKLLTQFGLMESSTQANPNINLGKNENQPDAITNKTNGLFEYAQYLMQLMNAKLKTGSVTCNLDQSIQVGYTYYDTTKYKFGYIQHLSKKVTVGSTATMALGLTYVRDAVPSEFLTQGNANNGISAANTNISSSNSLNLQVAQLPVLTNIENAFSGF